MIKIGFIVFKLFDVVSKMLIICDKWLFVVVYKYIFIKLFI